MSTCHGVLCQLDVFLLLRTLPCALKRDTHSREVEGIVRIQLTSLFAMFYGQLVLPNSKNVLIADTGNNRLQLLSLTVSNEDNMTVDMTVDLAAVRCIGEGELDRPSALALYGQEHVLVVESRENRVSMWNTKGEGTRLFTIGSTELNSPGDVTVFPNSKRIAIADTDNHRVAIYDDTGKFIYYLGSGFTSNDIAQIQKYGANNYKKGVMLPTNTYDPSARNLPEFNGKFQYPFALAVDATDQLIVLDDTNRLQVFRLGERHGEHIYTRYDLGILRGLNGLEWWGGDGGRLSISNPGRDNVQIFVSQ